MATAILHTAFQKAFSLDHAELSFLSVMYYQQKQNGGKPLSFTQEHITNLTGVGIYAQRRVRKSLSDKRLMSERRSMVFVEGQGYRTTMHYNIACKKLDNLLQAVEQHRKTVAPQPESEPEQQEEPQEAPQETPVAACPIPSVRMHLDWQPDSEALAAYLNAYDIESRFAVYDVLPEFVEYWTANGKTARPAQWQARFQTQVRKQWDYELNRRRNQSKIQLAADRKADAIAAAKSSQAQRILDSLRTTENKAHERRQPTTEELTNTDWADKYDFDFEDYTVTRNVKCQPTTEELFSRDWIGAYDFGLDMDDLK